MVGGGGGPSMEDPPFHADPLPPKADPSVDRQMTVKILPSPAALRYAVGKNKYIITFDNQLKLVQILKLRKTGIHVIVLLQRP